MLKLRDIKKDYLVADSKVEALKGVNLSFRKSEFVSILGPSGCGKTTLLNIIGGLDKYTSGQLFIDDIPTSEYGDRDWDTYRNHRIGFVFQSYNLIPHQTILQNVALALAISGVGKDERIARAKEALDNVGLAGQYNKRPNQLSGGQCQRVAIARALVNKPDILLADEPTGALDTKTSQQIMDLIKEISKNRLVIMVTHNPEIAEKYSTRIIKLVDGKVVEDSKPYNPRERQKKEKKKEKKSKLSFWTAFRLSARNLWSKFKRTFMVCIAGSIGIIGVATVLAVSTGVTGYVQQMQDDMLSGNPITVSEETINLNLLTMASSSSTQNEAIISSTEDGVVNVDHLISYLYERSGKETSLSISNDITQEYIDYLYDMPAEYYAAIATYYGIDVSNNVYTTIDLQQYGEKSMSLSSIEKMYIEMLKKTKFSNVASLVTSLTADLQQYPNSVEFIESQYDIVSNPKTSHIATEANEIMLVVSDDDKLTDMFLGQLGYFTQEEFLNVVYKAGEDEHYDSSLDKEAFSYDELIGKSFVYYPNDTVFVKADSSSPFATINPFNYSAYADESWTTGTELKITAVLRAKEEISYGCLESGIYYTPEFTKKVLADGFTSQIVDYLNQTNQTSFNSTIFNGNNVGITYNYSYYFEDVDYKNQVGFVGEMSQLSSFMGAVGGGGNGIYELSLRDLGGIDMPNKIAVYPTDFTLKDKVTDYLDEWNSENDIFVKGTILTAQERNDIVYSDTLELVINLVNNLINMVTYALVAFTGLSLVVSTVMIAIITYVSVIERVKEIGVIRALGGRKKDVSHLFNAESFIIGGVSGIIGIVVTYLLSLTINTIVGSLTGIYTIASLSPITALIMIAISIGLTSISGLIPAKIASKKDPVVALRTE